jgi:hypothetical protein
MLIKHDDEDSDAVVEIKVWEVNDFVKYPDRIKYSLYCLDLESHEIIVGLDNHYPKGHHLHIDNQEQYYFFEDVHKLVADFYALLKARGYSL